MLEILPPEPAEPVHRCELPGVSSTVHGCGGDVWWPATMRGAVLRCDVCGRYWHADPECAMWRNVGPRKVRRLMRRRKAR